MELKTLLEQFKNGEVEMDKVIDAVDESKTGMVPRSRLNDKNAEIDELKAEIAKRDDQIVQLQKSVADESEIQTELDKVKSENEQWQEKFRQSQLNNAIKLAVAKEANDANDVLTLLNKDQLELSEDGTVKGLEDAINTLKESKPYLFTPVKPKGYTPPEGGNPTLSKQEFDAMNYADKEKLYQENPEVFKQLSK